MWRPRCRIASAPGRECQGLRRKDSVRHVERCLAQVSLASSFLRGQPDCLCTSAVRRSLRCQLKHSELQWSLQLAPHGLRFRWDGWYTVLRVFWLPTTMTGDRMHRPDYRRHVGMRKQQHSVGVNSLRWWPINLEMYELASSLTPCFAVSCHWVSHRSQRRELGTSVS
jgi:hypothetical protein